jgi:putative toxin-antitoxin system antitoxin component (TIGR02293 family)
VSLARAVHRGLSVHALTRFAAAAGLSPEDAAALIHLAPRTLARRRAAGHLAADESDRLLRAARTLALALDLFEGDADAAKRWLDAPQRALGGEAPRIFAMSDVGAREVERLAGRLEHGVGV